MEPLPAELELESHLWALEFQGFTRVESAIPPQLLERVQSAFHAIIAGATPGTLEFGGPLHKQRACVIAPDGVIEATQPYEHHPALLELLFPPSCFDGCDRVVANEGLAFSPGEPALNVYYQNGCFNPHKDYCALTVLIPLSSPDDASRPV